MRPDDRTLRSLLSAGLLAPSAENKHHLQFRIGADAVELLTTDHPTWAEQPHRQWLALLALGAVLENIALESGAAGFALQADTRPLAGRPERIARLSWAPPTAPPDALRLRLASRHTNRRFYARDAVAAPRLAVLTQAAAAVEGCAVRWLDAAPQRRRALRAIRLAETERFRRRALHRELFGAVRFEIGWKRGSDEWLAPAALQVEAPMRLPFAAMRHWPLMRAANLLGAHHAFGLRAGHLPSAGSPHLGLVTCADGDDRAAALAGGRAFQRLWLAADAQGLALQPLAAATALARQRPGGGWVSAPAQATLRRLLAELVGDGGAQPCLLFRLGTAPAPDTRAGRRPLEAYLID